MTVKCVCDDCTAEIDDHHPFIIIKLNGKVALKVGMCEDCLVKHKWRITRINSMVDYGRR